MSEARLGSWIDQADGLFVLLDCEGRVQHANEACLGLLGWSCEDLRGQDWFESAVPSEARGSTRAHFTRIREGTHEPVSSSVSLVCCRDGTELMVAWSHAVLRKEGHTTGTLSLGRRQDEERDKSPGSDFLVRRVQELSEDNAVLRKFARSLSHDVKSPLQSLVGRLDLLLIRPDLGEISRRDAVLAMEAAQTLSQAINDLAATWAPPGRG